MKARRAPAEETIAPPKWWAQILPGNGRAADLAWADAAEKITTDAHPERAALGIPLHATTREIGARARAVRARWQEDDRRRNGGAQHRIPAKVAGLGRALDLVIEDDGRRTLLPLAGSLLLAPADAFDRAPGAGRIYIVRGKLEDERAPESGEKGAEAFRKWHARAPDLVGYIDTPPPAGERIGRAVRIGYASDKWTKPGEFVEYEHDFTTPGPLVYSTGEERPRALILVGGRFTITKRGIVE